jgi:hypothetical protein
MAITEFKHGDSSDLLANNENLTIEIYSVVVKKSVKFKAFVTQFVDSFDTNYDDEFFGGNIEPTKKMTSVVRKIQLGWDVVANGYEEAKENTQRASALFQMLYPERVRIPDPGTGTNQFFATSGGTPLFKIRFLNLIGNPGSPWGPASMTGLLGYLDGISYDIDPTMGFFKDPKNHNKVFPQNMKFGCTFYPQNIVPPSHIQDGEFNLEKYPYQVDPKFSDTKGDTSIGSQLSEVGEKLGKSVAKKVFG